MLSFVVASLLTGCTPKPAEIKIDGAPVVTVNSLAEIPLPNAKILDSKKQEIKPAPVLKWTITPATVAKLSADSKKIVPLTAGEATIEATVNNIKASFKLDVALPDAIEIVGVKPDQTLPIGQNLALTAKVLAKGKEVAGQPITWASSDVAFATVADGRVTGVALGDVTIKATSDKLAAEAKIKVVAADAAAAADDAKGKAGAVKIETKVAPRTAVPAKKK